MDALSSLVLLLTFLFSICLLRHGINSKHRVSETNIKPYPVVGYLPQFLENRHRLHDWMTEMLAAAPGSTLVFHRPGNVRGVGTANPANVEHFLKSNFDNFPKGRRFLSTVEDFLGDGIFNSGGELWKIQRKVASFEFNSRSLRNFVVESVQQETATRLFPLLNKCAESGQVIDMQDVLERYAFNNVCKVAFGEDPACLADVDGVLQGSSRLSGFAAAFQDAAGLSAGRFFVILAGQETMSSALTWFFRLVSLRPHVQRKVLDEITAVQARTNSYNETFGFDELREMHYLHAAVTESMRLYPPVPANITRAEQDDVLPEGTEIRKGWFMSYNSYAMGRMEAIWGEDCREYRPERWPDEEGKFQPESPFKFVAFHAGPRMCLGKEMAYIQMKSIAACMMERFEIEVVGAAGANAVAGAEDEGGPRRASPP